MQGVIKNMNIKSLQRTSIEELVNCLLVCFEGYPVQMPSDLSYWKKRFIMARVDYDLSYGMFHEGRLVGFIVNGIDQVDEIKIAFNTGTGVIPQFRGAGIVDKLYAHAIPGFIEKEITDCRLEVITTNERAIKVYERIGFARQRLLKCFRGELSVPSCGAQVREVELEGILLKQVKGSFSYSWDNVEKSIWLGKEIYKACEVYVDGHTAGYFIINPGTGYIAQLELYPHASWDSILNALWSVSRYVKINNVDERRVDLLDALTNAGLENHIDQYEMDIRIG